MKDQFLKRVNSPEKEAEEKGNVAPLSDYVESCRRVNRNLESTKLIGVTVQKEIIESRYSCEKVKLKNFQLVQKDEFVVQMMSVGREESLPIGFYDKPELVLTSGSYHVFKVINSLLMNEYLMMIFRKDRFNREVVYNCRSGVRASLNWKDLVKIKICVPPLKTQEKIVHKYQLLERLIKLKRKINDLLERWMQAYYHVLFDNLSEDQYTSKTFGELFHISGGGVHQDLIPI